MKPITAAKAKNVSGTFGEKKKIRIATARAKYTPASESFMRRVWMCRPIHRLPRMLKSPMMESDQALTVAGSWQSAT